MFENESLCLRVLLMIYCMWGFGAISFNPCSYFGFVTVVFTEMVLLIRNANRARLVTESKLWTGNLKICLVCVLLYMCLCINVLVIDNF